MANLILNPGLETGDFTSWTTSADDTSKIGITNGSGGNNPLSVTNSGVYSPAIFQGSYSGYSRSPTFARFTQTIATTPGAKYDLSFWIGAHGTQARIQVDWGFLHVFDMNNPGTNPDFWPTVAIDKTFDPSMTVPGTTGSLSSNGCTACGLGGLTATGTTMDLALVISHPVDLWFFDAFDLEQQPSCPDDSGANAQSASWSPFGLACPPTFELTVKLTPAGPAADLYCSTTQKTLIFTE